MRDAVRDRRWVRIERYLDVGDPGAGNSYYAGYRDLDLVRGGGNLMNPAGCPDTIGSFIVGFVFRPRMSDGSARGDGLVTYAAMNQYISELYVDRSFARVEIGNAPQWEDCTHREIQIASAWNGSEIRITSNVAALPTGSQAYLFGVDENRQPSSGFPIIIGQSYAHGDPGPPGAPGTVGFTPLPD